MPWDVLIRNGQCVLRDGVRPLDLAIEGGKIVALEAGLRGSAKEEIDATDLHIFPGVIDPHVHFNEPGRTDWEGFATGSAALAAGGGTCFFDMPLNSSPPTLDGPSFDFKLQEAKRSSLTDFALWGGLTPKNLGSMEQLAERGVIGFKAFMCPSGIGDFDYADLDTLQRGMEIAAKLGLIVAVHAEVVDERKQNQPRVKGHTWEDYLRSRPVSMELTATTLACAAAKLSNCALHVVHVSDTVILHSLLRSRQTDGVNVSWETCPHYYMLNDADLMELGARAKCAPPLRPIDHQRLMKFEVATGQIDFVASDHSPAPASMKTGNDAFAIWGGISGVQSTLASLLTVYEESNRNRDEKEKQWKQLKEEMRSAGLPFAGNYQAMSLTRVAALSSANVASRFGIANKGSVQVGFDADLALVDVDATYTLTRDMLLDRHKLSPYVGRQFRGLVKRTISRGQTIFLDGKIVGKPQGRLIKPTRRKDG